MTQMLYHISSREQLVINRIEIIIDRLMSVVDPVVVVT